MKSLIEKLKNDYDYYIDNDKKKLLDKLAERYSKASYYEIFGVSESMTVEDAKTLASAFKQITLKIQPDNTSGAVYEDASQKLFQIVKNAYETLSDPDKELAYKNKLRSQGEKAIRSVQTSEIEPSVQTLRRRTFFTKVSTSESAEDQVYNRDIRSGETIETIRENITINGNVHGTVKSMLGTITVNGCVFGEVNNVQGTNIIRDVDTKGKVVNISGSNLIKGNAFGEVRTTGGSNTIMGYNNPNSSQSLQSRTNYYSEGSMHTVFNSGDNVSTSESAKDQVYNRDIRSGETIETIRENITINGNVHGTVKSMLGTITVNGCVFGEVNNVQGTNIIRDVDTKGKVVNISGSNLIKGNAFGEVRATGGSNTIMGYNNPNSSQSLQSRTNYYSEGSMHTVFNSGDNVSTSESAKEQVYNRDILAGETIKTLIESKMHHHLSS